MALRTLQHLRCRLDGSADGFQKTLVSLQRNAESIQKTLESEYVEFINKYHFIGLKLLRPLLSLQLQLKAVGIGKSN